MIRMCRVPADLADNPFGMLTTRSIPDSTARVGVRPSTAKRHLADLRARSGISTEQLIYRGRAEGWLLVPSLEPH